VRALAAATAGLLVAGVAGAQLVDGVAAVVDEQVILLSEVESSVARVARRLERQAGSPAPPDVLQKVRAQAVQRLIDERLLLATARRMQLETDPGEVDGAIARIAGQEGVDVEAIYAAAEQQGLSREAYRAQIGEEILRMKVIDQAVRPRITSSEEDVRRLFVERYGSGVGLRARARHILVPWPPEGEAPREQAFVVAGRLRELALQGVPFSDLAERYSAAPSSTDGGLTVFQAGEVASELAAFVFEAEIGAISQPIETDHGVNLIQLLERFDPSQIRLEDVRPQLQAELDAQKTIPAMNEYLRELRKRHYVEIVAPSLR
jgi:peptidyl-prolyl cis-trans isomerase SurA